MKIIVTSHAAKRISKRIGVPKKAVQKLAETAISDGKSHSDFSGSMKRYLDSEFFKERSASNMRVWSGYLFIFSGEVLITVFLLPPKYR
jgi:hypothetical protein